MDERDVSSRMRRDDPGAESVMQYPAGLAACFGEHDGQVVGVGVGFFGPREANGRSWLLLSRSLRGHEDVNSRRALQFLKSHLA